MSCVDSFRFFANLNIADVNGLGFEHARCRCMLISDRMKRYLVRNAASALGMDLGKCGVQKGLGAAGVGGSALRGDEDGSVVKV